MKKKFRVTVSTDWTEKERKKVQNLILTDMLRKTLGDRERIRMADLCLCLNVDSCEVLEENRDDFALYVKEKTP